MVGVITNLDILVHPIITVQCFGWRVFIMAVFAGQGQTFLSLLSKIPSSRPVESKLPDFVDRCIDLELRAKHIYLTFAGIFANWAPVRIFFKTLASQEQEHADLLALCKVAAQRKGWNSSYFKAWGKTLEDIEQNVQKIESSLYHINALPDALQLVVDIESGEINRVFQAMLDASDSDFVRRLAPFQQALEFHIAYITEKIHELDSNNSMAAHDLRVMHQQMARCSSKSVDSGCIAS